MRIAELLYRDNHSRKYSVADRLKEAMKIKGLRQIDMLNLAKPFCESTGIKLGKNDLSQYVSGKVEPKEDKLKILSCALDVSVVWLMGYDVPMQRDNKEEHPSEQQLTGVYKELYEVLKLIPEDQQRAFVEMGRAYANSLNKG